MAEELLDILKERYDFLSMMVESVGQAIGELQESKDPERIYEVLVTFLGEFPTRRILQKIADEKNMNIRVKTREDAIKVIRAFL